MSTTPAIVFTDWDGTVTLQDSNDMITDNLGMGQPERLKINELIKHGNLSFSKGFKLMLDSISANGHTIDQCIEYLITHVKLDPGFESMVNWCYESNIPVIVVSSGMSIIINNLLNVLIKDVKLRNHIEIISNDTIINDDGSWAIKYRDNSDFGHDKNQSIVNTLSKFNDNNDKPFSFYCGDGVSDISASKSCDLLFAKKGYDLVDVCIRDGVKFIEFENFNDILKVLKEKMGHQL